MDDTGGHGTQSAHFFCLDELGLGFLKLVVGVLQFFISLPNSSLRPLALDDFLPKLFISFGELGGALFYQFFKMLPVFLFDLIFVIPLIICPLYY